MDRVRTHSFAADTVVLAILPMCGCRGYLKR